MAEKKVSLLCPSCGKDHFESLDADLKDLRATGDSACIRCACYSFNPETFVYFIYSRCVHFCP